MAGKFNPKNFKLKPVQKIVPKPWGHEVILTMPNSPTTGKIFHVKKGHRWSLQWHDQKPETICLISGQANIILEDRNNQLKEIPMELEKGYSISLGQTHRVIAKTDCILFESSLPEKGNTYRLEDDYQRPTETESLRKQKDRGWS